jgi:hypothetical protein
MKGGKKPQGYTVVEVMIFLAVTAGLFVAVATTFRGRQAEAEFSTASRDMESRLQDVINDVSTGYYSNPGNFTCTNSAGTPSFGTSSTQQGKNDDCIFIGRVAQFDLAGSNGTSYNIYTAAGVRQISFGVSTRDVQDLTQARPRIVGRTNNPNDAIIDSQQVPVGLEFANMYYTNGGPPQRIRGVGFFSTFATYDSQGLKPGTISVNVLPIASVGNTQQLFIPAVNAITEASPKNPSGGVTICFNGNSTNKYVELRIGGGGRELSTDLAIRDGRCPVV